MPRSEGRVLDGIWGGRGDPAFFAATNEAVSDIGASCFLVLDPKVAELKPGGNSHVMIEGHIVPEAQASLPQS
ncbi:hypothetical protein C0V73_02655 [Rhizobium sp. TH135]|nr:hypothetical protein C0V73_02655 [Rhizobium sp. TH135]